jgi:hypothetical protein
VVLQSVTFHKFVVQAGTDASLVPTEMSTLNATVKLTFRNTGTFFGVHVTAQPVTLNYYQLVLASGDVSSLALLSPPFPTCLVILCPVFIRPRLPRRLVQSRFAIDAVGLSSLVEEAL